MLWESEQTFTHTLLKEAVAVLTKNSAPDCRNLAFGIIPYSTIHNREKRYAFTLKTIIDVSCHHVDIQLQLCYINELRNFRLASCSVTGHRLTHTD